MPFGLRQAELRNPVTSREMGRPRQGRGTEVPRHEESDTGKAFGLRSDLGCASATRHDHALAEMALGVARNASQEEVEAAFEGAKGGFVDECKRTNRFAEK